jgi:hypothetical protein
MPRATGSAFVAAALLSVWSCAKQTSSDLGGGAISPPGGKSGAGAAGRAGSAARGGGGGSGAVSSGGTGTGTGGAGGTSAGTGNAATGGSGGSTGGSAPQGGDAGDNGLPPGVLENTSVVLRYIARNHDAQASAVDSRFFFENKADAALGLSNVLVRYWTTPEVSYANLKCYYAAIGGSSNVTLAFVDAGADSHIDLTFASGEVPAHNAAPFTSTEFQMKLDAQGGSFDQSNDWSFDGTLTSDNPPAPNPKVAVYLAGELVWGCEPNGTCAGEGGAAGAAGQGGQGGQNEAGAAGDTTQGGAPSAGQGGEPAVAGQGGI